MKCTRAWRQGSRALNNSWQHVIQQSSNVSNQVNERAKRGIEPYTNIMIHHTYHFPSHLYPLTLFHRQRGREGYRRTLCQVHQCPCGEEGSAVGRGSTQGHQSQYDPLLFSHAVIYGLLCFYPFFHLSVIHSYLHTEKEIEDTRVKLEASIKACQMTFMASSAIYAVSPGSAEIIWKVLSSPLLSSPLLSSSSSSSSPSPPSLSYSTNHVSTHTCTSKSLI